MSGKPWAKRHDAPKRITGRTRMARNARIKLRDGYQCRMCGRITDDLEVDHLIPLSKGGTEDEDNLQSLCLTCHDAKSRDERGARRTGCDVDGIPLGGWG